MRGGSIDESAAARARWLSDLSEALADAQDVIWQFSAAADENPEILDLYARVETIRVEVRALQLRGFRAIADDHDPKWTNSSPWLPGPRGGC